VVEIGGCAKQKKTHRRKEEDERVEGKRKHKKLIFKAMQSVGWVQGSKCVHKQCF
jgi:hypothetical protein